MFSHGGLHHGGERLHNMKVSGVTALLWLERVLQVGQTTFSLSLSRKYSISA